MMGNSHDEKHYFCRSAVAELNTSCCSFAIPIPATLSLELGRVISEQQANISYRFVSDFPFKNRTAHALDAFETRALVSLRDNPNQQPTQTSWSLLSDRVRHITPIIMGTTCVACHNTHPDSPKSDWKVGDIRG